MLNWIWLFLMLVAIVCAGFTGQMEAVTQASMNSAKAAVTLSLGLIGVMAFWLGMMRIARDGGLLRSLARLIRPLMIRLFPDIPAGHPATSAMVMNMASNMLGLGNAATPFGIKAMMELDRLNKRPGVATDAMALFLAINTSNVSILPLGVIAIRASLGSQNPSAILLSTFFATCCSTVVAIVASRWLSRLRRYRLASAEESSAKTGSSYDKDSAATSLSQGEKSPQQEQESVAGESLPGAGPARGASESSPSPKEEGQEESASAPQEVALPDESELGPETPPPSPPWAKALNAIFWFSFLLAVTLHLLRSYLVYPVADLLEFAVFSSSMPGAWLDGATWPLPLYEPLREVLSYWLLPALIAALLLYGMSKGVKVYDALVTGAKEGFEVALRIIPYLVAILVAVGMFRASGALGYFVQLLAPLTTLIGMPPEALPMAILRPLSGSGAYGVMTEIMLNPQTGPDTLTGYMVSTFQGSTETTFYVLAVYFGAVQVKQVRHTLAACLIADTAGIFAAIFICRLLFA